LPNKTSVGTERGCREVELWTFCWQYGLDEDLTLRPPAPVVDPVRAAVEQNGEVRRVPQDLELRGIRRRRNVALGADRFGRLAG
jgi:hypothetical protein